MTDTATRTPSDVRTRPSSRAAVVMSWSGGKDSAMALHALQNDPRYEVAALLTTLSGEFKRISHHGVREELLDRQAAAIGLPLHKLWIPPSGGDMPCTHGAYAELMGKTMQGYRDDGIELVAHGDIFLAELRKYREDNLAKVGMRGVFPLWGRDTTELVQEFEAAGFRAILACVTGLLDASFVGRELGAALLDELPAGVDPCGEHGEYHTFVWDGPIFDHAIEFTTGEIVTREVGTYIDLLPRDQEVTR